MKTLTFTTKINATRSKVWNMLWKDSSYREWARVFSEGSHAVSDWEQGSKVLFLSADGDGMFSIIEKKIPNEVMSFIHLGVVRDGKVAPVDEETKKWSGAMETYTLTEKEGQTELKVDLDTAEDMEKYFNERFPKALAKVKALSEN